MLDGRGVMRRCTARFAVERDNEAIVVLGVVVCAVFAHSVKCKVIFECFHA